MALIISLLLVSPLAVVQCLCANEMRKSDELCASIREAHGWDD